MPEITKAAAGTFCWIELGTTDVAAGFVVGIFWVAVSAIATEIVYRRVPRARPVRRPRRGASKAASS